MRHPFVEGISMTLPDSCQAYGIYIGKYLSRLRKLHCMIAPTEGFET
jgi:uncharacterized membrane protein